MAAVNTPAAPDSRFSDAYPELRRLAQARLQESGRHTLLDTTALVHESYLRLSQRHATDLPSRQAFLAHAARVMREVIVAALREQRQGEPPLTLDTAATDQLPAGAAEVLRVHEALAVLAQAEPRLAEVVQMRYFGGYTEPEIGAALGLTERTVRRDWEKARLLLLALLR